MLTGRGGQGAGGGRPGWAGPQGCPGLKPRLDTPTGAAGLSSQSVSCVTRSSLLASCQPALKSLSERHTRGLLLPKKWQLFSFPFQINILLPVIKLSAPNKGHWLRQAVGVEGTAAACCPGWEARSGTLPSHTDSPLSHHQNPLRRLSLPGGPPSPHTTTRPMRLGLKHN